VRNTGGYQQLVGHIDVGGREKGLIVRFRGILDTGAIDGPGQFVRCMLMAGRWQMLEFVEGRGGLLVWHGEVGGAIFIIPFES
jgi:hypothetical protein